MTSPKADDLRHLVGRTYGARRRLALSAAGVSGPGDALGWDLWKQVYRVGVRIRPCLGCADCNPAIDAEIGRLRSEYDAAVVEDGPCRGMRVVDTAQAGPARAVRRLRAEV